MVTLVLAVEMSCRVCPSGIKDGIRGDFTFLVGKQRQLIPEFGNLTVQLLVFLDQVLADLEHFIKFGFPCGRIAAIFGCEPIILIHLALILHHLSLANAFVLLFDFQLNLASKAIHLGLKGVFSNFHLLFHMIFAAVKNLDLIILLDQNFN